MGRVSECVTDAGGIDLFVARVGEGPELVVIHGGPDWDHTYLRNFMGPLAKGRSLIFFDLRGCGRSQRFDDAASLHVTHVLDDIRHLMNHFGLSSAAFLGFSFGGRIALELVRRFPSLVGALILASSSAYGRQDGGGKKPPPMLSAEGVRAHALASIAEDVHTEEARKSAQRAVGGVVFSNQWLWALHSGNAISFPHRDYSADLRVNSVPTLVLHGRFDRQFPIEHARRLVREVPSATLVELPSAGHLAHIDAPDQWNAAVHQFLQSSSAA